MEGRAATGATVITWIEAGNVARHPAAHRAAPVTKNEPVQNNNSTEADKPCFI